jgi:hypothetical protein
MNPDPFFKVERTNKGNKSKVQDQKMLLIDLLYISSARKIIYRQ